MRHLIVDSRILLLLKSSKILLSRPRPRPRPRPRQRQGRGRGRGGGGRDGGGGVGGGEDIGGAEIYNLPRLKEETPFSYY